MSGLLVLAGVYRFRFLVYVKCSNGLYRACCIFIEGLG